MEYVHPTYSVLVVSALRKLTDALAPMLPGSEYDPVCYVNNIAAARRELLARHYDFVMIQASPTDDYGSRFAIDCCGKPDTVALLLLRPEVYEQVDAKVAQYGVFTLPLPCSAQTWKQGLKWMAASRERLRKLETKTTTLEQRMEEIRLVNRAKWLLIEQLKMTEAEAHHYIERQAMDRCIPKKEIALGIIRTYSD